MVAGHEEVGSPSQHLLLPIGVNLPQVLVSLNVKIKDVLPVHKLKSDITQKSI